MKIALGIIAKDEIKQIERIIKNYAQYFDEICIAIDDQKVYEECFENYREIPKIKCFKYEWKDDFADKRNWLEERIESPYYFRLDTDDEILGAENIREVVEKAGRDKIAIVYCTYLYSRDEWGNINAQHNRETIVRKDDNLYWNKPIHENILPKSTKEHRIVFDKSIVINHLASPDKLEKSFDRNVKYLVGEFNRDKENTDPRTLAYLGRMLFSAKNFDKALFFLEKHIEKSGWDEDRYHSWCMIAEIMIGRGQHQQALGALFEALAERPDYPDAYFKLHDIYQEQKQWDKAIFWAEEGLKKPIPETFTLVDPSAYTWRPTLSLSFCYFQKGDFEKAKKFFDIAEKQVPTLPWVLSNKTLYQQGYDRQQYMNRLLWIIEFLRDKEPEKIKTLVESIPSIFQEDELVTKLKNTFFEPKVWEDNEIAIFCGHTSEPWSPKSVKTGIGGSEEAVINLSEELNKLGYKVKVYNTCYENEGNYEGVEYLNSHKFNPNDNFNILISWRMNIFPYIKNAKKKLIWLHDLPCNIEWNKEMAKSFDKIIALSQYHKSLIPKELHHKVYVSSNGIVPKHFKKVENALKIPKRIIWTSSYNRGLETILRSWKEIRQAHPDAEIHIFYGWQVYDQYVKEGYIKDGGWKDTMLELMKQRGVYEHGRMGHEKLLEEYAKSSVFAYPCNYSGEINCVSLTKAIACGCNVVTNKFAVMAERSPNAVEDKKFIPELIRVLGETNKKKVDWDYIHDNSWTTIAKDWKENLFAASV